MQSCDTDSLCQIVHMNFAATENGWKCSLYKSVSDCESGVGGADQYIFVKPGAKDYFLMVGSQGVEEVDNLQCSNSTKSFGAFEISVLVLLSVITLSGFWLLRFCYTNGIRKLLDRKMQLGNAENRKLMRVNESELQHRSGASCAG